MNDNNMNNGMPNPTPMNNGVNNGVPTPTPMPQPMNGPMGGPTPQPMPANNPAPSPTPMPANNPVPSPTPMNRPVTPTPGPQPAPGPVNNFQQPMNNYQPPMNGPMGPMPQQKNNMGLIIGILVLVIAAVVVFFVIKPFGSSITCKMSQVQSLFKIESTSKITKNGSTITEKEDIVISYENGKSITESEYSAMKDAFTSLLNTSSTDVNIELKNGKVYLTGTTTQSNVEESLSEIKESLKVMGYSCN
jgi:hypothetical protein